MELSLEFSIGVQPDNTTCGPTCLQAVYAYYGDVLPLTQVISEVRALQEGGTLAVFLARHALRRGYDATIITYNVDLFDPTWFRRGPVDLADKLKAQAEAKNDARLRMATEGYLDFLEFGGRIDFADLTPFLIYRLLDQGTPILTGLSSTYLYQTIREIGPDCRDDDIQGLPVGHFVVVCGYHRTGRQVLVADPLHPNPVSPSNTYAVDINRAINSIMLGVLTYDANLLILKKTRAAATGEP